jgi:hypothetical protein
MENSTAQLLRALPVAPSPEVSEKYMFIDSHQVVQDMQDLGFGVAGVRRPNFRSKSGEFGVHELDFRRAEHLGSPLKVELIPRVVFTNSYDGSRRAELRTGMFRVVCSNGLVVGTTITQAKFLHLGDYASELLKNIQESAKQFSAVFDRIEKFRTIELSRPDYIELAERAISTRYPGQAGAIKPEVALLPRRLEDTRKDLFTTWNVLQENLIRGGIPATRADGKLRITPALARIIESNRVNAELWDLMEEFAERA